MRPLRSSVITACLLFCTISASHAGPIAVLSSGVGNTIVGVMVGSSTYNVTFASNVADHTFDQNIAGEAGAASQIETALNATSAAFLTSAGAGSVNQFIVGNVFTGGQQVASFSTAGNWHSNGFANNDGSASVFTAVAGPTVVLGTPKLITAVDGLVVDGITYNVTFVNGAVDHTFDTNPVAEGVAAAELENALNATTGSFIALSGVGSINQFIVGNSVTGGIQLGNVSGAGAWFNNGIATNDGSAAVFTVAASVPEPAAVAILSAGIVGLAMMRRRHG